eukprot:432065-Amphidinium_carterae.1
MRTIGKSLERSSRILGLHVLTSAVSFFIYQLSQMMLMSKLSAVSFSVMSPLSKVMVIATCAVISGDDFGVVNIAGMAVATGGVLLFSLTMRRERIPSSKLCGEVQKRPIEVALKGRLVSGRSVYHVNL